MKKLIISFGLLFAIIFYSNIMANAQITQVTSSSSAALAGSNTRAIAKDSLGNYYVTFSATYNGYGHIFVRKTTDGGATWQVWNGTAFTNSGEVPIESSGNYHQSNPTIAIDGANKIYLVWTGGNSSSTSYSQVRYSRFTTSWSLPSDITSGNYTQSTPSISVDSNNYVHAVWSGTSSTSTLYYQIRYSKFTTSWSLPANLTSGSYDQKFPSIAVDGNNYLHVVWDGKSSTSTSYTQIWYSKYTSSWSVPVNITSGNYNQNSASIAVDSSNVPHVVWHGVVSGFGYSDDYIYYSKNTGTWSAKQTIDGAQSTGASIAIDGSNNIYVVWNHQSGYWEDVDLWVIETPFHIRYSKYSTAWSAPIDITSGSFAQSSPMVSKDASLLVWKGTTDASGISSSSTGIMFSNSFPVPNTAPTLSIASATANQTIDTSGTITISGTVTDPDVSQTVRVSATIAGIYKYQDISTHAPNTAWSLSWLGSELGAVSYTANIDVTANDGAGSVTGTYTGDITVTSSGGASLTQVSSLSIADGANYGDARDIKVTFTAPNDESKIKEYRIYILTTGTLNKDGALTITDKTRYAIEEKNRIRSIKKHVVNLPFSQRNVTGAAISGTGTYYVYVLTVGLVPSATTISSVSNTKTISMTVPNVNEVQTITTKVTGNSNDATDLTVVFSRAANETPIKEYKIFLVPNGATFNLSDAVTAAEDTLHPLRYTKVAAINKKTTKIYTVRLNTGTTLINDVAIQNGVDYDLYILSVPKNMKVNYYNLSSLADIKLQ